MPMLRSRRSFVSDGLMVASVAGLGSVAGVGIGALRAQSRRRPQILLRSSWQSVNIGDIGHSPGALSLLGKHFPEAEVTLWPNGLGHGSRDLLVQGYPGLRFVEGSVDATGKPTTDELARAWEEADLYLSGSGSGFPASNHALAFAKATGKPMGVFGVSTDPISGIGDDREPEGGTLRQLRAKVAALPADHLPASLRYVMDRAAFFFCRDTISREYLRAQRVQTPALDFGPDAQLGMHLRDDAKATAYLSEVGLREGRFVCVVPRLRYTPYYRIHQVPRAPADDIRDAINQRTTEQDHAKLREMMVAYVRQTGNRVLACPEMTYQVELAKQVLVDPLPEDVRRQVVWMDRFWLPDEAASVYARAAAVVSMECHSPLIAYRNGTPAFYVRQPTDTCKGQMYRDFGADDWFFEVDETSGEELWQRLRAVVSQPERARAQVGSIMRTVDGLQKRMVELVRATIGRA
ncbi:MAG: polysaccharide pyruvyl transferase family protein [Bryobacterales bacterium]|nr:polysaccharide pyruvyl transferase family protein [Bryobacterales bacterium]